MKTNQIAAADSRGSEAAGGDACGATVLRWSRVRGDLDVSSQTSPRQRGVSRCRGAFWMAGAIWAAMSLPGSAAPPPPDSEDYELLHPFAEWIGKVRNAKQQLCCNIGDGTVVDVREVLGVKQIHFRAFDRFPDAPRGWVDVPDDAIVVESNQSGMPIAWWYQGRVRCFLDTSGT